MPGVPYPIKIVNGVPVVAAPQEIDIHNADCVLAVLLEAARRGHATFVVDMTRTHFCASSGIGVLVQAHKQALADGAELRLVMPTDYSVLRVFAITGIDQVIPNFTSLDQALEPAPAAATRPPRQRRRPKPGMRTPADQPPAHPDATQARPDNPRQLPGSQSSR